MKKLSICLLIMIIMMSGCSKSSAGYKYESARLQYDENKYDKALEYIDEAIKSDDKQEYLMLKGQILYKMLKYDDAIAIFTELGDFSDSVDKINETKYKKAEFLLSEKNYDEALAISKELGEYR